jgi:predicted DNA-binding transcriptional regulator YafY
MMRADRLLSLLMLLQTQGPMTAESLAQTLEVSVRTIYRDLDALSYAGVPVYTERGPGGGCGLLDPYRTNLTGLTENEVRALFMLSVPAPLSDLGVREDLQSALLKLTAALPETRLQDERSVRQRFYLDSTGWDQTLVAVPHLKALQQAVWEDRPIRLTYRIPYPINDQGCREVDPYGLVAKAGVWYLVGQTDDRVRVFRVADILGVQLLDIQFSRPETFNLGDFWSAWCTDYEANRLHYPVKVRVDPELLPILPLYFGDAIREQIAAALTADAEGWLTLDLLFERVEAARDRILGFGRAMEVLEPEALRLSVIDFAAQIVDFYE